MTACKDDEFQVGDIPYKPAQEVCGVTNATENLDWLKAKIEQKDAIWNIYVCNDNGQDLILIHHISSSLAYVDEVYDCQGNKIDLTDFTHLTEKMEDWVCIYHFSGE